MEFKVFYELKHDKGEDSPPIVTDKLLCVCDGMGGSGGSKYILADETERTGAYIASRIVSKAVENFSDKESERIFDSIKNCSVDNLDNILEDIGIELKESILKSLTEYAEENNITLNTRVKSSLIKLLPTTLAAIIYRESDLDAEVISIWAGDSRCYAINEEGGLMQLSKDDLRDDHDAMENLIDDSPMSNNISLSTDFKINVKYLKLNKPIALFVATDGCFGYFKSPMEFEEVFLKAFEKNPSFDLNIFSNNLLNNIKKIAKDDASIAGKFLGFDSLINAYSVLSNRYSRLKKDYLDLNEDEQKIVSKLKNEVEMKNILKQEMLENIYLKYKKEIVNYLSDEFRNVHINNFSSTFGQYRHYANFIKNNSLTNNIFMREKVFIENQENYFVSLNDLKDSIFEDYLNSIDDGSCNLKEEWDYHKASTNFKELIEVMEENSNSLSIKYTSINEKISELLHTVKSDFFDEDSFGSRIGSIRKDLTQIFLELQRYSNLKGDFKRSCFKEHYEKLKKIRDKAKYFLRRKSEKVINEIILEITNSFYSENKIFINNLDWIISEKTYNFIKSYERAYKNFQASSEMLSETLFYDVALYTSEFLSKNYKTIIDFICYSEEIENAVPREQKIEFVNMDLYIKNKLEEIKEIELKSLEDIKDKWLAYKPMYEKYIVDWVCAK